ncbi:MAG: NTP transferase domain-containing protein [Methanobacterium sp.]|uniref:NTP transferase domain-containing protein n=1 Tax=Methanobacterium sp. TaxID=2164 RepID=UPI003C73F17B
MVTALIMAGGKGTRMECDTEKPLIELFGIPMIQHVIDALSKSNGISDIMVATSHNTPKTSLYLQNQDIKIFQTPGNGYVEDLQYYISENFPNNSDHIILTITSDLPLITNETIDYVLNEYNMNNKPAMCVAVPVDIFREYGLKPSIVLGDMVPSGLNILRSNNKQQDEEVLKLGKIELAVNINSCDDIVLLEKVVSKSGLKI